ncbi:hypothetical protein Q9966_006774 [Columba livia]|nr:hypothetical protein Q9966_006774 [Columba livia]
MRKKSGSAARLGAPSRPGGRCRGSPSPPCPDGGGGSGAGVTEAAAEVELEAAHGGRRAPAGRDGTEQDGAPPPRCRRKLLRRLLHAGAATPCGSRGAAPHRRAPPGPALPSSSARHPRGAGPGRPTRPLPPWPPAPGAALPHRSTRLGGGSPEAAAVEEGRAAQAGYRCPSRTLCPRSLWCRSRNTAVRPSQQTLPSLVEISPPLELQRAEAALRTSLPLWSGSFVPCCRQGDNTLHSSLGVTLLHGIRD